MPSRSMVNRVARAVGTTRTPLASTSASTCVAIASISGTTTCGRTVDSTMRSASASSMSTTCERCATCMAGASA